MQAEARAKEERLRERNDQLELLKREAEMVRSNVQDSPAAKVALLPTLLLQMCLANFLSMLTSLSVRINVGNSHAGK